MTFARFVRPWVVVTLVTLAYAVFVMATQGGALALVTIGTRFSEGLPDGTEGYDGQFGYYIAVDPVTAPEFIAAGGDFPAYRFQRILLPALGRVGALGQPELVPWALLVVNLIALAVGTACLEALLQAHNVSRWYALGYGLSLVGVGAARLSLTEPLAYGLALVAMWLIHRERWLAGAALFALAALAKETALLIAAGYGLYLLFKLKIPRLVAFSAVVLTPFAVWQVILYAQFGRFGVGSGGNLATGFEVIPFAGVIRILTEGNLTVFLALGAILLPFVILPTAWGLWRVYRDWQDGTLTLMTAVLFTTAAIMLFVPFSTYREPLGILRFIAGLQIAVIVYAAERKLQRPLRYSLLWSLTTLFVLSADLAGGVGG